jgi:hypothetical protein
MFISVIPDIDYFQSVSYFPCIIADVIIMAEGVDPNLAQAVSSNLTVASIHTIGSASLTPQLQKKFTSRESSITGTDLLPICRICQMPGDAQDPLFSPCRCSGTLGFIHFTCLKVSKSIYYNVYRIGCTTCVFTCTGSYNVDVTLGLRNRHYTYMYVHVQNVVTM